jgi:hypothetical protein
MNLMMPIYTVRWEREAATQNQKRVEAGWSWLARVLASASEARQAKEASRSEKSALRRISAYLAQAGA